MYNLVGEIAGVEKGAMCGRGDFSAQNAHGCPDGSDDEEEYVQLFLSQFPRYVFQVFKTNRNAKQERISVSFHYSWGS
ncbi:MAG: hypothetical protein ACQERO_03400 [Bacteroidota bacterium]